METRSSNEEYNGECDMAFVNIEKNLAKLILKRARLFKKICAQDGAD
jgi:hypothetical protein